MWKILLISLILTESLAGGFEQREVGSRSSAFGNAFVGLANDVWANHYNPAGLASLSNLQLSAFYSPQPFGISEISLAAFSAVIPTSYGVVGVSVRRYGFELYREHSGSLAYSNMITGMYFGINLNYHAVSIKNYGSTGAVGIDLGILIPLIDNLRWGISMKNINSPTIGRSFEKISQCTTTGLAYHPFENINLMLDVQKETSFDPSTRFGFEYWIIDPVAVRGGYCNEPASYSSGFGIRYSFFNIDYALSVHPVLGWTHSFSITIQGEQ